MGKSSSSRRKRRSGASPPARMKKKTKSGGRTKSKKLRQRHDSESSSSDYDAQSMSSASFSSSGDEYQRRKRSRSPARTSTKGLDKKKSRRYSYSSESSEDLPPRKKRKGSRKDDDLGTKKKKYKKKRKHRARRSLSSSSRDYSTSEESEFERHSNRDRDERKTRDAERTSSKRSRHDSRSCSPCGKDNLDGADHDERLAVANIPVRLKSVIVIVNSRDERSMELEEPKEEIVYDHDEYPSCRSNDSNDGGNKKELARDSKVDSKMEKLGTSSLGDERNTCSDVPSVPEVQNAADTSGSVDLELILRQRALENLKRLRGLSHKGKEVSSITRENNGEMKQSAATSAGSSQNALPKKVDSAKAANGEGSNVPNVRRNLTNTALVEGKSGGTGTEGGSPKPLAIKAARQITGPGSFSQRVSSPSAGAFTANSPRVNPFTWRRDSSVTNPVPRESQIPQSKPPVANLHVNKTNVKVAEPVVSPNKTGNDAGASKPSASKTPSLGDETASVKMKSLKNEAEDGLQRRVASMEPQLPQAKHSHDAGPIQPCGSASKDPSSRGLREVKSVNVEPKIVPQRRMIPTSKSHPHANKAVSKEGSVKLDESANKATTAAEANEPRGSASEEPSSSVVDEATPGGEVKSEAAKDGTQYEQKTMTVVRGGEMIRVNYQVYIPKRAPALARRQLKR